MKEQIEFFVYLADYQQAPFIEWAHTPLDAINKAINNNITRYPGIFAKESELSEPNLHFRSLSGYWIKDPKFPVADKANWDA